MAYMYIHIDLTLDLNLDSQSFDVRNPQSLFTHTIRSSLYATGQVNPRLRHFSPLSEVNDCRVTVAPQCSSGVQGKVTVALQCSSDVQENAHSCTSVFIRRPGQRSPTTINTSVFIRRPGESHSCTAVFIRRPGQRSQLHFSVHPTSRATLIRKYQHLQ